MTTILSMITGDVHAYSYSEHNLQYKFLSPERDRTVCNATSMRETIEVWSGVSNSNASDGGLIPGSPNYLTFDLYRLKVKSSARAWRQGYILTYMYI